MARLPGDRGVLRLRARRRALLLLEEQPRLGRGLLPLLQEHVFHTGRKERTPTCTAYRVNCVIVTDKQCSAKVYLYI